MSFSRIALPAIALSTFTGGAQAQDFRAGGQLTLSIPQGDLGDSDALDGKLGYGLGLHGFWGFGGGHAILPRLDYTMYKKTDWQGEAGVDFKVNDLKVGADYNFYLSGRAGEGFYFLGGLGYSSLKWEAASGPVSLSETKGTFYLAAGGGFMFTPHVGAELRYTHAKYTGVGSSLPGFSGEDMTGPAISASLLVRF